MENNTVATFTITKVSEFYDLPKNTLINVNNIDCKLLWNNEVWFGVECFG